MTHSPAVISAYIRSPFTPAHKGALARTRPDAILASVLRGLVEKSGVNPVDIEDVIAGCAFAEGEQGFNIGRMAALLAGLPVEVAGQTVNRWCGSSMEAIHIAAGKIASHAGEVFIAAGVESMTRIPMGGYNMLPNPDLYASYPEAYMSMGLTAENLARHYGISRVDQEAFAVASHQKAAKANFADEIVAVAGVSNDGCVRADTSLEALAGLKPAFDAQGTVTAGTSSPLTDGAAAVLVVSEAYADRHGLPKLARIKASAVAGLKPEMMGLGPVYATRKVLERAELNLSQIDIIEMNEAFAAQSLACIKELELDVAKLNREGGAVALGHPLGASGARITGKAAQLLKNSGGKYALSTACIGLGMGIATVLEAI